MASKTKKPRNYHYAILPLCLSPQQLAQLRETMPHGQRSRIILDLLQREGYLKPKTENSPEAA